jgi:hypothetical protein
MSNAPTPAPLRERTLSLLGGTRHSGRFDVPSSALFIAGIGGMDLDLREATLPAGGATITKVSLIGGVSLVVPPGVRVEVSGFSLLGGKNIERESVEDPSAPVLRVRAFGLIGGVKVRVGR